MYKVQSSEDNSVYSSYRRTRIQRTTAYRERTTYHLLGCVLQTRSVLSELFLIQIKSRDPSIWFAADISSGDLESWRRSAPSCRCQVTWNISRHLFISRFIYFRFLCHVSKMAAQEVLDYDAGHVIARRLPLFCHHVTSSSSSVEINDKRACRCVCVCVCVRACTSMYVLTFCTCRFRRCVCVCVCPW